jgi:uncharacterized membrane protein
MGAFETSLPIRMDFEAMLAYLLLPPAGGVFLLLVEHKSDYVRYVNATLFGHLSLTLVILIDIAQLSRLAVKYALYCHVCKSSNLFRLSLKCAHTFLDHSSLIRMVKLSVMVSAPMRFGYDWLFEHACLSRR